MSELAIRQAHTMSLPDKIAYAQHLAGSNLLPTQYRQNPANLLFALEYAEALGVSPINAITSIHVIEGKPSASADLIASMVRKAGHRLRISGDDSYALAQLIRADDPEFTYESRWTMDKARSAGLANKGVWRNYPGAMLRSRAITEVARMGATDALFGVIYTPEELGAEVGADGEVITVASSREPAPSQPQASAADRLRAVVQPAESAPADVDVEPQQEPVKAAAERVDRGITRAQLTALNAALTQELGFTEREDKLAYLSGELGRDIASSQELTKAEASRLIDKIKRDADAEAESGHQGTPDPGVVPEPIEGEIEWPEVAQAGAR